ncbi:hypothetical protein VD0004_g9420 [Verticillium dahliae]|uniref:Uncharacterized protein n=1 Tax=Verticillium dahliae TaxID=27337 RepID=A0A366NG80_VERDA|nr:hypothetical protein VD0004_g9420 [Verticillium dahliae]PNH63064.1 hypothetical protein VD0001_g9259 [Verticillium dahliae]RBQ69185.1 hypothetical protein VDGD_09056 [Verticillium dahliae]RXG43113.1 hypothetical protein VDGE_09056 [Verticillium dahliae]
MLKIASIVHGICLSLLIGMVEGIDQAVNPTLVGRLKLSPTELDKIKLLSQDSDWTFDYFASDFHNYSPGGVVNANAATFPATIGNGMTMSWLTLGPCAMLPPHYHPRASNYVVAVEGTTETFMTLENGCENATLVSALSSEDAGTHNVANGLFGLPSEILAAAFGDSPLATQFAALAQNIPAVGTGASEGSSECMRRCEGGPSF